MKRRKNKLVEEIVETSKERVDTVAADIRFTTSGADILDLAITEMSGKGYPWGGTVNIVGDKSAGKTLFAIEALFAARRDYGKKLKWYYDDAEAGLTINSKKMYGFDLIHKNQPEGSRTIEEFGDRVLEKCKQLKPGERLIYILDSLDGVSSNAEVKRENENRTKRGKGNIKEEGSYGLEKQKGLSAFFRTQAKELKKYQILLIIVSQVRDNIGVSFGRKQKRVGGKALDFYAFVVLWLAVAEKHKSKGYITSISTKVLVDKNKVGPPLRECFVEFHFFGHGFDNLLSNILFLYNQKTEKGKNKDGLKTRKFDWDGVEYSLRHLIRHIEKNDLEGELSERVSQLYRYTQDSINPIKGRKARW